MTSEPCNLREWIVESGRLFTCGRPGRGYYGAGRFPMAGVPQDVLLEWVAGVAVDPEVHIVSLLGTKTTGTSEFRFYPFRSEEESNQKPTFQEWLEAIAQAQFKVCEFPTTDYQDIDASRMAEVVVCVRSLLKANNAVVLVDSAGSVRTGSVRRHLGVNRLLKSHTGRCAR